jgi:hypothetical protein
VVKKEQSQLYLDAQSKMLPQFYQTHLATKLNPHQLVTLELLVRLLQLHKQVRIQRRFSPLSTTNIIRKPPSLFTEILETASVVQALLLPITEHLIKIHFCKNQRLFVSLDRTQWKNYNLFVVSVIWSKRAWPIYWNFLDKRGCSNLSEQQALLRPVIRMLKSYDYVIFGDREFHSVELGQWLCAERDRLCYKSKIFNLNSGQWS